MSLLVLTIPTERGVLISWLEQNITGLQLGQLVAELSVLHESTHEQSLTAICGDQLDDVLESGLTLLSDYQLSLLLTNPVSLLELQEQAFISGSLYWAQLANQGAAGQMAAATAPSILKEIHRTERKTLSEANSTTAPELQIPEASPILQSIPEAPSMVFSGSDTQASRRPWMIGAGLVVVCTAAMLLLMLRNPFAEPKPGWGFDRSGALSVQMPAPQFLEHLSQSGKEWFNKRPDSPVELEQRLTEFSRGCQTLIDADLPQLDDASRDWLRTKCRRWKAEIDGNLVTLQQSPQKFTDILEESDALIQRLVVTLRNGPAPSA